MSPAQTDAHKLGPVQTKISQLEEEKRQVIHEREKVEARNRDEIDGLRATEGIIQEDTQLIKRWWWQHLKLFMSLFFLMCFLFVA